MPKLFDDIDVNEGEARFIAAGLRALARCDGLEAAELGLVEQFERELGTGSTAREVFEPSASPLRGAAQQGILVRSLLMLALVDGRISSREEAFIESVCRALGVDDATRNALAVEAAKSLLASFSGVRVFRDQAVALGRGLGLDDAQIAEVLG